MSLKRTHDLNGPTNSSDLQHSKEPSKKLCLEPLIGGNSNGEPEMMDVEYQLVERNPTPGGISLVHPGLLGKRPPEVEMELSAQAATTNQFMRANVTNKLNTIGKLMNVLHNSVKDVITETEENLELHRAACNFVKRPGGVYHLYQKESGQKYFSMLSPSEWVKPPHNFLGSYRLEADLSWTKANEQSRYPGIEFLKQMYLTNDMRQLMENYE